MSTGETSGRWAVEVTLEGWIVARSLGPTQSRDGFNVIVTTAGGENLRYAPNGAVIARFEKGALLGGSAQGGWTQVSRAGWVPPRGRVDRRCAAPATPAPRAASPRRAATAAQPGRQAIPIGWSWVLRSTPLALTPDGAQLGARSSRAPRPGDRPVRRLEPGPGRRLGAG